MSDLTVAATPPARFARARADLLAEELIHLPLAARYAVSLFLVGLTTGLALAVERLAAPSNIALLFVTPVVLAATAFGWGPSLAAVAAGVVSFDFFFTEPRYSLEIASASDVWAAGLLLVVAAIVSGLAATARRRVEEARDAAMSAEALRVLAHKVVEGRAARDVIEASADTLSLIFRAPAVVFASRNGALSVIAQAGGAKVTSAEEAAVREVAGLLIPVRGQTYPFPHSSFDLWPVAARTGDCYVLGVDFRRAAAPRPRAPERSVDLVAACLAAVG